MTLHSVGIGVSIDDSETGCLSLAYLKRFDIGYLKTDRSLVHNPSSDEDNRALCETMVVLAHKLRPKIIVEGVETTEQWDFLKTVDCDFVQGFPYSTPVPSCEFGRRVWPTSEKCTTDVSV